ncbi:hypothetical protein [Microbacterium sp.]|uniref:hypothetical protein n=1 Tax=Microbacterium sp. TaxID=51671 RepID=UPI0028119F3A|nr:hypothetical protein [Microbacterium sp.]
MLDEADAARRRELQRRAFSRGDALNAAETAELRDLDLRSRGDLPPGDDHGVRSAPPARAERQAEPRPSGPDAEPPSIGQVSAPEEAAGTRVAGSRAAEDHADTGVETVAPRRRMLLMLALLAAVVLGFAGGMLLPGRTAGSAVAMTAEQREQFTQIETSGDYDPGSVRFAGAKHGAAVWSATREEGASQCIVLSYGDKSSGDCFTQGQLESWGGGVSAQLQVSVDGEPMFIVASIQEGVTGESFTVIRRHAAQGSWRDRFTPEEVELAEVLVDAGLDVDQLQIVGYDDETPVWLTADGDVCLLVVDPVTDDIARGCGQAGLDDPVTLSLPEATYSLKWHPRRGPLLTVIRESPSITCDIDSGYCGSIDDTTGEIR